MRGCELSGDLGKPQKPQNSSKNETIFFQNELKIWKYLEEKGIIENIR